MANSRHKYNIVLPTIKQPRLCRAAYAWEVNPLRVTIRSRLDQRRAVWRLSELLSSEKRYGGLYGYGGRETDPSCVTYMWLRYEPWYDPDISIPCVGAACFREEPGYGHYMAWVWFHPYCRRSGLLSSVWKIFEANHPNFGVASPLSPAMLAFLEKRGHAGGIKGWHAEMTREKEKQGAAAPEWIASDRAP